MPLTPEQIASLYDRHGPEVLRFLTRRSFDPETAVDLLSETFTQALRDRRSFRGASIEEARGWVFAIARSRVTDHFRRVRSEQAAVARAEGQRRPLHDDEFEAVERFLDARELREALAAGLGQLSEQHQEVLRLRVVEERSFSDIAVEIGESEQTVRARLSRALRALRSTTAISQLREELRHA